MPKPICVALKVYNYKMRQLFVIDGHRPLYSGNHLIINLKEEVNQRRVGSRWALKWNTVLISKQQSDRQIWISSDMCVFALFRI